MLNRILKMLTLCAGRMYPTHVGGMFPTYEQVYTYKLKMAQSTPHLSNFPVINKTRFLS